MLKSNMLKQNVYGKIIVSSAVFSTLFACTYENKVKLDKEDKKIDQALTPQDDSSQYFIKQNLEHFILAEADGNLPQNLDFSFFFDQKGQPLISYMRLTDLRYPEFQWLYVLDSSFTTNLDSERKNQLSQKKINFEKMNAILTLDRDLQSTRQRVWALEKEFASISANDSNSIYLLNQKYLNKSRISLENLMSNISNEDLNQWLDLASKSVSVQDALSLSLMYPLDARQFKIREAGSNPFLLKFSTNLEEQEHIKDLLLKSFHPSQRVTYLDVINFLVRNSLEPNNSSDLQKDYKLWVDQSLSLIEKINIQEKEKLELRKINIQEEIKINLDKISQLEEKLKLQMDDVLSKN